MDIFKLVGSVFVDTDEANKSLAKTDEKAEGLGNTLLKGAGTAAKWGAGIATAAGAVGTAMISSAKDTASNLDVIDKASQRMNISAESYQELAYQAELCGVEMSTMEKAAKKLEGTGINMDDAIQQIYSLTTAEERSAKAAELFGDSVAYNMSPMLNQSAESMANMAQEARDLGIVMSNDSVSAGAEMNDSFTKLQESLGGLMNQVGTALIPFVNELIGIIIDNMPTIQEMINQFVPILSEMAAVILPMLANLAQELLPVVFDLIGSLMPFLQQIIEAVLPVIIELLDLLLPPLIQIIQAVMPVLTSLLSALMPLLQLLMALLNPIIQLFTALIAPILELISSALTPLIDMFNTLMNSCLEPLQGVIKIVSVVFDEYLGAMMHSAEAIIGNIIGYFEGVITFLKGVFTGDMELAFKGICQIVENVFGGIVNYVKTPLNLIIGLVNGFIEGLNKLKIPDWVPGVGGKGINIPKIPLLAKGGDIVGSGTAIVGEAGPEMIDLPVGARVTPLKGNSGAINTEELASAIESAFANVLQSYGIELTLSANTSNLFDDIVEQNVVWKNRHGGASAFS